MALMLLANLEARRALRRERIFRDRKNPLDSLTEEIYQRYRFTRHGIIELLRRIGPEIEHVTQRSNAISAQLQLLTTLRFFATGSFYTVHGDLHDVSIASVCRIVHRVSRAITGLTNQVITFPANQHDATQAQQEFFAIAGFPEVVGAVDGTHIRLHSAPMGDNEHLYVNRKGYHSINVQLICSANFTITNVVARWPGCTHDSAILHGSVISDMFNGCRLHGVLIGDTGYPLRPWLMTPILDPTSNAERHYNRCHRRTRVRIEQTIGQLKKKFPCLSFGLRVHPERACRFIKACCILFNLSKTFGEPEVEEYEHMEDDDPDAIPYNGPLQDGEAHRNRIIDRFF